jgi:hypothetical protein
MGTKLIITIAAIFVTLFISCSGSQKFKKSDYYIKETDFINSYKTAFICGCINGATNDSLKTFMANIGDNGLFTDIEMISYSIVKEADSTGRLYSKKIVPINYEDAGYRKPIVAGCIKLGLSKDVDKIAKVRYKRILKSQ